MAARALNELWERATARFNNDDGRDLLVALEAALTHIAGTVDTDGCWREVVFETDGSCGGQCYGFIERAVKRRVDVVGNIWVDNPAAVAFARWAETKSHWSRNQLRVGPMGWLCTGSTIRPLKTAFIVGDVAHGFDLEGPLERRGVPYPVAARAGGVMSTRPEMLRYEEFDPGLLQSLADWFAGIEERLDPTVPQPLSGVATAHRKMELARLNPNWRRGRDARIDTSLDSDVGDDFGDDFGDGGERDIAEIADTLAKTHGCRLEMVGAGEVNLLTAPRRIRQGCVPTLLIQRPALPATSTAF